MVFLVLHVLGNWTLRYEPHVSGTSSSLFGVGAMLGSTVDTCSALSRVAHGRICTTFLVTGWTWILRSILVVSLPANMAEDEVSVLVVDNGRGMLFAGFTGTSAPRAVFTMLPA